MDMLTLAMLVCVPIEPVASGIEIQLSSDRRTYLDREPIFVEWQFTNRGPHTLRFDTWAAQRGVRFECIDETGEQFRLCHPIAGCGTTGIFEPARLYPRREKYAHTDLRSMSGIRGPGKYRVRAIYDSNACQISVWTGLRIESNWITIEVIEAKGADAVVTKFIENKVLEFYERLFRAGWKPELRDEDERGRQREAVERYYRQERFFERHGIAEAILQFDSLRFRAVASYYSTFSDVIHADEHIQMCLQNPETSEFVRALAIQRWFHLKSYQIGTSENAKNEAKMMALWLIRHRPDSSMAADVRANLHRFQLTTKQRHES